MSQQNTNEVPSPPTPNRQLLEGIVRIFSDIEYADIDIIVGQPNTHVVFSVHRVIFAKQSSWFNWRFQTLPLPTTPGQKYVLCMPHITPKTFSMIYKWIYRAQHPSWNEIYLEEVAALFENSMLLGLDSLQMLICENVNKINLEGRTLVFCPGQPFPGARRGANVREMLLNFYAINTFYRSMSFNGTDRIDLVSLLTRILRACDHPTFRQFFNEVKLRGDRLHPRLIEDVETVTGQKPGSFKAMLA